MSTSAFQRIMTGLEEARRHISGVQRASVRKVEIESVRFFTAHEFRALRERMSLTQQLTAIFLGVKVGDVVAWEKGSRTIPGPVARLFRLLGEDPAYFEKRHILSVTRN